QDRGFVSRQERLPDGDGTERRLYLAAPLLRLGRRFISSLFSWLRFVLFPSLPAAKNRRRIRHLEPLLRRHNTIPEVTKDGEVVEAFEQTATICFVDRAVYLVLVVDSEPFCECLSVPRTLRLVRVCLPHRGRAGEVEHAHNRDPVVIAPPLDEARHRFRAQPDDFIRLFR